ncbi:MAG: class I SAM-dependent methyltransferase [Spirochaetia bacterium]|nr:class I SAM-dependent methyltransferase [Spirochaetia bacterium]
MNKNVGICTVCQNSLKIKFSKYSEPLNKEFKIFTCNFCGLWQIFPLPQKKDLVKLYEKNYFSRRTSRGYHNYESEAVKRTIQSTFEKNLKDLHFYSYENQLDVQKSAFEIGAAAGYFTEYLKDRGWASSGIDVSGEMTAAAQKRGVPVIHGDFLLHTFGNNKFDLITLWATLEHLPDPEKYLHKMSKLLKPQGHIYISTAHTGFWAKFFGKNWRYLNVPEHVFYFNRHNLQILLKKYDLKIHKSCTYGSGFTSKPDSSLFYKILKKIFDFSAKRFHSGDMIVIDVIHNSGN